MKALFDSPLLFAVLVVLAIGVLLAVLSPPGKAFASEAGMRVRYGLYLLRVEASNAMARHLQRMGLILPAVSLPNGALVHIAAAYGAWKTMSALSNADPAVATLEASHGVAEGDIIEVDSGWSRLGDKIVRAGTVSTNDVELEGIDTSSTSIYAAGSGTGRVREITSWTQLDQILNSSSQGGEQQFLEYQFLESDGQRRIPTTKSAFGFTLLVADDMTKAGQILCQEANDDRLQRAIRITFPSGKKTFYNAYISIGMESLTVNEIIAREVTFSLLNEPVRYSA